MFYFFPRFPTEDAYSVLNAVKIIGFTFDDYIFYLGVFFILFHISLIKIYFINYNLLN